MPQSLAQVHIHAIFATKARLPTISDEIKPELYAYLATVIKTTGGSAIKVGGHDNHVHLLFTLSRTTTIAETMEDLKVDSSKWMKTKSGMREFAWQKGYGIFSVSAKETEAVKHYIENQAAHHKNLSFEEEFLALLAENNMSYDERYLWDD
ncbi:MAG TPA: IS200/IS605 family transposase [Fimbriimonas sp.]|nr:IS200/IS605 family transposase [Fimbriimonas sp.]